MYFNIQNLFKQISVFVIVFLILNACETKLKEYPNVTSDQIGSFLKWSSNYTSVREILTEDFKSEFSNEIEQERKNKVGKVYQFKGGKLNDIDTEFWKVVLENDSLIFINISIATENPEETKQVFDKLTSSFQPDTIKYPNEERWYIQKDGKRLSEIQIMKYPDDKGIFLTFFKPFEKMVE